MLINKSDRYEVNEIVSFRLVNGDELVAKVVDENESQFSVTNPLSVFVSENGMQLARAMLSGSADQSISIRKDHVMLHSPTVETIADHYREITTGIKAVRKGSIIV